MMKWKLTIASALWKVKVCDTSALEWVLPAAPSCLWWDLLERAERWSRRRTLPALNTQTHDTRELTIGTHNSTAGYTLQRVSPSLRRIRLHSSLLRSNSVGQTTGMLPANGFSCWIINYTHIQTLQITLYIIQHITGIVHPKIKMCSPSDHPRLGWVCFFIRFVEMCLCISVSAMDALQWMGAIRMRVQTRDATIPFFQIRSDLIQKILSIGRFRSNPILAQFFFFFFINQCRVSILLCHFCVLNTS